MQWRGSWAGCGFGREASTQLNEDFRTHFLALHHFSSFLRCFWNPATSQTAVLTTFLQRSISRLNVHFFASKNCCLHLKYLPPTNLARTFMMIVEHVGGFRCFLFHPWGDQEQTQTQNIRTAKTQIPPKATTQKSRFEE